MDEVIVKDANIVVEEEEESDGKMSELMLPRLMSLKLDKLPCLKGFCIGKADFSFSLLDTLTIHKCRNNHFHHRELIYSGAKRNWNRFGSFYVEEDVNTFIKMKQVVGILNVPLKTSHGQYLFMYCQNPQPFFSIFSPLYLLNVLCRNSTES